MSVEEGITPLGCYHPSCENPRDNKKNGQCIYCQKLYHFGCIGIRQSTVVVCKKCRDAIMQKTVPGSNDEMNKLKTELDSIKKECEKLKQENQELKAKLKNRPIENHLVMSDSMLRDVDQGKLDDTKLVSVKGARVKRIKEEIGKLHGASFQSVTHIVGTNDLYDFKDDPSKIPEVIDVYKELINETKAITGEVIISSVCPRLDEVETLVNPFNDALQNVCQELPEVTFVDNTGIFTLSNGDINDGYLWGQGPHLTKPAVNKLVRNLKIKAKNHTGDVTRSRNEGSRDSSTYANVTRSHDRENYEPRQRSFHHSHSDSQHRNRNRNTTTDDVVINRNGCRFCNEPGHNVDTCRHTRPVVCNKCHGRGHKDKHHRNFYRR